MRVIAVGNGDHPAPGAGNAFLGGLAAGLYHTTGDVYKGDKYPNFR